MKFREFLSQNIVRLDGGMGTQLQARGLLPGEHPERWNLTHPEAVREIHTAYYMAGSNVVSTNTFGANPLKFADDELEAIISAAIANVRAASDACTLPTERFTALDIGPTGRLLKPLGDLDFEDAVEVFAKTVRLGVKYGADLIIIETMNDAYETKAALLAAKENSDLPVIVTNAYGEDGKLMTGASPAAMCALLEGMGADAIGANCSLGPKQLKTIADELLSCASVPVVLKPNAGMPRVENGKTVYDVTVDEFCAHMRGLVESGVRVIGGCCGTTPEYIAKLTACTGDLAPVQLTKKSATVVSSYTHAVTFGDAPILIGERINPTGKKRFKQALAENDIGYILGEAISQQERGVHILDVNVGMPGIDEADMLTRAVYEIQAVTDLPLQIDTADAHAMESALRRYNGKPLINSVNGKKESMDAIFPLVKKYGGAVIALTLDENGIPADVEGRVAIAKRIAETAESYGIDKKELIFDTLAMTVSADPTAANVTIEALRRIRCELGCHTSLGVSNVSFGLPSRDAINGTFYAMALACGLSAAIINPNSAEIMKTYHAYMALRGFDENCAKYIEASAGFSTAVSAAPVPAVQTVEADGSELRRAIEKGMRERAGELTGAMLANVPAMEIVTGEIIPALNRVGEGFEKKTVYLPQLMMSAEAAQSAFERIKAHVGNGKSQETKGKFVIATVKGDIHDIGKNIVKLLLENYGYDVTDLGRDVPADTIVETVIREQAPMCGLSALMTTTVPAMEETIRALHEKAPWCKVIVGGAVLTRDYAERIGADYYAKDAMETVRTAESIMK